MLAWLRSSRADFKVKWCELLLHGLWYKPTGEIYCYSHARVVGTWTES